MTDEQKWNEKILNITMTIRTKYPELSKYIEEMPVTIPDVKHPIITKSALESYYESLDALLLKYIAEHPVDDNTHISKT